MIALTASQLAEILGTGITDGSPAALADGGVSTDTRTLPPGCIFFALRGENFDADTFAQRALDGGANIAVVHHWQGTCPEGTAVLEVPDTLQALQRLAHWWRKQLDIPVVAITGSNGKTSTKDFTKAVLAKKFNVSATKGNLNNHIGVPLTVLATTSQHTAAVWEMGMNHSGEIAPLCEIAKPKYGIITNIGTAHIEFLGSRDAIAEEKSMLARLLPADGALFMPAYSEFLTYIRARTKAALVAVGNGRGAVRAEDIHTGIDHTTFTLAIDGEEPAQVRLPVPGRHMVTNALLAAAAGWKLGISPADIADALSSATLTSGRLGRYTFEGITVIDDTYNANPESMAAAIDTLADTPVAEGARRIIVLGRMGELGDHAQAAHLKVGKLAAERNLTVIAAGEGTEEIAQGAAPSALHFPKLEDAAAWLRDHAKAGDIVLFKGSRTATIEKVMNSAFPKN